MKLSGLTGTGTGKLGSTVFSVNAGEQIVRQYQSTVANPSTTAQVNQRAKLKLMSQISAAYAAFIAIPKEGMKSARNLFTSKNIKLVTAEDGTASINLPAIQLTAGTKGIPAVTVSRDGTTALNVALASDASKICDRVVYIAVVKNAAGDLQFLDSAVVETAGTGGTFAGTLAYSASECVVYAYGIKDADAAASAAYANYNVASGAQIATLVGTRAMSTANYSFTKTTGIMLAAQA